MKKRMSAGSFWLFLLPSAIGILVFYMIPYVASYYYAFTDASTGTFSGLENYAEVLSSPAFDTSAENAALFMMICVPLNMVLPFLLAYLFHNSGRSSLLMLAFMLPLVIPSGATVYFWRVIFGDYGVANKILSGLGMDTVYFMQSGFTLAVVTFVFICKNMGFNMVLFIAGLGYIPREYYEAATVEGCSKWYIMRRITLLYLLPTTFMTLLMSIVNSFKIFREIYLLFGEYPHPTIYMLQHYMNNLFSQAALQKLSVTSTVISLVVAIMVSALYFGQKKLSENL